MTTAPYLIVNHFITPWLRKMPGFELDLGRNLLNDRNEFETHDEIVSRHVNTSGGILHRLGDIGQIPVYADEKLPRWALMLCFNMQQGVCRRAEQHELTDIPGLLESMLEELLPEKKKKP